MMTIATDPAPASVSEQLPLLIAALASNPLNPTSMAQFHCIVNTVISLIGASLSAFIASGYFCNQFDMVHIQVTKTDVEHDIQRV